MLSRDSDARRADMKVLPNVPGPSNSTSAYAPLPHEPPSQPLLRTDDSVDLQYRDDSKGIGSESDETDDNEMAAYGPDERYLNMRRDAELANTSATSLVDSPVREVRKGDRLALYVTLAALGTFLVGTWLIVLLNHPSNLGLFAAHPPLQSLAITCFGCGILLLQPTSQPKTKARGLTRHQLVILGVGLPAIIIGTVLIFMNKVIHESAHFTTWHATFGLIAIVWMVVQMLLGGLSVWFGGRAFGGGMKAKGVWKYHRVSGYLLFPMFLMTAAIGGNYSDWTANVVNVGVRVVVYTLAPIFALVGLWSRMRLSKMNFRP